jgi:hypothetical protein
LLKRLRSINSGLLLTGYFIEVSAWIAAHPATTRARRIDSLAEGFGVVTDVSTPVETACRLQSSSMMPAQGALHVLHRVSPDYGRHPRWVRPVV